MILFKKIESKIIIKVNQSKLLDKIIQKKVVLLHFIIT
jgi:hypothetical protein